MESIIDDIKKVLGEKFNGLDTKEENFQEKAQAIVDEIIEVNKEKIGNFVPHKTRDEELAREMEIFKKLSQLNIEGDLDYIPDEEVRDNLKQQAKDGIVDEEAEKISLEKAGFLKEPQKILSVEDIIEEVLNKLEEIVETKKKEIDEEIAKKEEIIKKIDNRERLRSTRAKIGDLHQESRTFKGIEGKKLNENIEKAIVSLDKEIDALVIETTVDGKELQSEDLKKEKEELIEQKNKLDDMLKVIKEKYVKDKGEKETENMSNESESPEDNPDKDKIDKENAKEGIEEEKADMGSKEDDKDDKKKNMKNSANENGDRKFNKSSMQTRIGLITNKVITGMEPNELVKQSERMREFYIECINELGYTKEEMKEILNSTTLNYVTPMVGKSSNGDKKSFTAGDLMEIGKINEIRKEYIKITSKTKITEEDKNVIKNCEEKFKDISGKIFQICNKEILPLQTLEEYDKELGDLRLEAQKGIKREKTRERAKRALKRETKAEIACEKARVLREVLKEIINVDKSNLIYEKFNKIIYCLRRNPLVNPEMIPEELEHKRDKKESLHHFEIKFEPKVEKEENTQKLAQKLKENTVVGDGKKTEEDQR